MGGDCSEAEESLGYPPFPPIRIGAGGEWTHRGQIIRHDRILAELKRNLEQDSLGRYWVSIGPSRVPVELESTPFRVVSVQAAPESELILDDFSRVSLVTMGVNFAIDGRDRLFCRVHHGRDWALVSRGAHQQLQPYLVEDGGCYWLEIGGRRHPIEQGGPGPIARHADT